jgi:hypothetical protein
MASGRDGLGTGRPLIQLLRLSNSPGGIRTVIGVASIRGRPTGRLRFLTLEIIAFVINY